VGSDGAQLQWHLAGGQGGIKHLWNTYAGMEATFKILGTPNVTDELKQTIVDGVLQMRVIVPLTNSRKQKTQNF
jgi:hypothetical protein